MKRYRIVCFELARIKNEYYIEAESPEDARDQILGDDPPEEFSSLITECLGDQEIESISEE